MKKIFYILSLLVCHQLLLAQNPEIKSEMPTIIPPSPTVAALMKFEEVPVSNYTGIPDISIPLFNTSTLCNDITLDISLKYHPGSNGYDEVASDVGLGWSLFAGGTISRTVRGLPDEILESISSESDKIGLHQTSVATKFEDFIALTDSYYNSLSSSEQYSLNEHIWDYTFRSKFDSQYDLWQFNFMGRSGRFYIKKNLSTGLLEVQPLDDYRVKINYAYGQAPNNTNNTCIPTGFTIYDEKGNSYVFDVVEKTRVTIATNTTSIISGTTSPNFDVGKFYNSAFHLSKVFDTNNNPIVEIEFNDEDIRESRSIISNLSNEFLTHCAPTNICELGRHNGDSCSSFLDKIEANFYPKEQIINSLSISDVKKIKKIKINGKAKVNFFYEQGRPDSNMVLKDSAYVFKGISITDWNDTFIKKYVLEHSTSTVTDERLILTKVVSGNEDMSKTEEYVFGYEENSHDGFYVSKDYWGYFNLIPNLTILHDKDREPTPSFSTTDLLQKIKYPTGGCAIFDFEANQYSYIDNNPIENFDENPDNWHEVFYNNQPQPLIFSSNTVQTLPVSTVKRKVIFKPSITLEESDNTHSFSLVMLVGNQWDNVGSVTCPYGYDGCSINYELLPNEQYGIRRNLTDINVTFTDTIGVKYFEKNSVLKEFLYGGGNRIKRIGYFTEDVEKDYYQNSSSNVQPAREKKFNYDYFVNANKSSGVLVFGKPVFTYYQSKEFCTPFVGLNNDFEMSVNTTTTNNNLLFVKTQGADVGYKEVTVYETNNGKSQFEYTTNIDYPEGNEFSTFLPPFLPTENFDYKRGLLTKESHYDETGRVLSLTEFDYEFVDSLSLTGIKTYFPQKTYPFNVYFQYYSQYRNYLDHVEEVTNDSDPSNNNEPYGCVKVSCGYSEMNLEVITKKLIEAYGWAKLKSKTTKNYFYDSGNNQKMVQTDEAFTYNPLNKLIDEHRVTNSLGDVLKTKYYYHTGNSTYSQNRIAEIEKIETYKGSDLLSTNKIVYSSAFTGNASLLPSVIQSSKGGATLENRVRFNAYDAYGHPMEVQQEDGTLISYLWGYNHSQPIAKIENVSNADLMSALGVSDLSVVDEGYLGDINDLRVDPDFANAMITSYTYYPLKGVDTITDPKGFKTKYHYDDFGRLLTIMDTLGNVISENEYHYRTQN